MNASQHSYIQRSAITPEIRELQQKAALLTIPGCYLIGFGLIFIATQFSDPWRAGMAGLILLVVPPLVWQFNMRSYLLSVCILVSGIFSAVLLVASYNTLAVTVTLMALPVALTALLINTTVGIRLLPLLSQPW
jgi:hypothetical protein